VALDELGPVGEAGLGDVAAPRLRLPRVVLQREHAPAEDADAGGQPDRRVAARAADLEDLAGVLRRDEREEEATGGRDDRARAELARDAALTLLGVLPLEALQHRAHPFVEHAASLRDEQGQTPGLSLVLARRRFRPRA